MFLVQSPFIANFICVYFISANLSLFYQYIQVCYLFFISQDMYPAGSRGRQASAPAGTRGPGRPISGAYGQHNNPIITRDEKSGGLMVNSTRMVSLLFL